MNLSYTLSLHDALPIFPGDDAGGRLLRPLPRRNRLVEGGLGRVELVRRGLGGQDVEPVALVQDQDRQFRSEEHTSELQSHVNIVCRLLLEKKYTILSKP